MSKVVRYPLRVRYFETDQMGVAHHANYLVWFEAARSEFCRVCGVDYGNLEKQGLFLPIVEAECIYKSPARYDEDIIIEVSDISIRRSILRIKYLVVRGQQELASGSTTQVLVDSDRKPVSFPQEIKERMLSLFPVQSTETSDD